MAGSFDPSFNCRAEIARLRKKIERLESLEGVTAEKRKYEDQNTALRNKVDILSHRLSSAREKLADENLKRKETLQLVRELRTRKKESDSAIIRYVDTIAGEAVFELK